MVFTALFVIRVNGPKYDSVLRFRTLLAPPPRDDALYDYDMDEEHGKLLPPLPPSSIAPPRPLISTGKMAPPPSLPFSFLQPSITHSEHKIATAYLIAMLIFA